jgi:hypothetical protein
MSGQVRSSRREPGLECPPEAGVVGSGCAGAEFAGAGAPGERSGRVPCSRAAEPAEGPAPRRPGPAWSATSSRAPYSRARRRRERGRRSAIPRRGCRRERPGRGTPFAGVGVGGQRRCALSARSADGGSEGRERASGEPSSSPSPSRPRPFRRGHRASGSGPHPPAARRGGGGRRSASRDGRIRCRGCLRRADRRPAPGARGPRSARRGATGRLPFPSAWKPGGERDARGCRPHRRAPHRPG